jgi:rod shape-determining protein MreD
MKLMDLTPLAREPMRLAAPGRLVFGLLFLGLLINIMPWPRSTLWIRPDFLLIVLLYWTLFQPRTIGMGWGFALGLIMDVADSVVLGQYAFSYVMAIFAMQFLRLRLLQLSIFEQAIHAGAVVLLAHALRALLDVLLNRDFPGWSMLIAPALAPIIWLLTHYIATLPRFRRQRQIIRGFND